MKRFLFLIVIVGLFLVGFVATQNGELIISAMHPQIVNTTPSQPFVCSATYRGVVIYVDDTDDTKEAYLCFCGVDADDVTYIWLKVDNPANNCF